MRLMLIIFNLFFVFQIQSMPIEESYSENLGTEIIQMINEVDIQLQSVCEKLKECGKDYSEIIAQGDQNVSLLCTECHDEVFSFLQKINNNFQDCEIPAICEACRARFKKMASYVEKFSGQDRSLSVRQIDQAIEVLSSRKKIFIDKTILIATSMILRGDNLIYSIINKAIQLKRWILGVRETAISIAPQLIILTCFLMKLTFNRDFMRLPQTTKKFVISTQIQKKEPKLISVVAMLIAMGGYFYAADWLIDRLF